MMVLAMFTTSCNDFRDKETPKQFVEAPKDFTGVWQLTTVSRNSIDITDVMDFSQFRLHLNGDNTYTLENKLPFVVMHNGKWGADDPQYPFFLEFQEEGAEYPSRAEILFPVVDGERQIQLTLSPGCASNVYVYLFKRVPSNN